MFTSDKIERSEIIIDYLRGELIALEEIPVPDDVRLALSMMLRAEQKKLEALKNR